jgi:fluoroquinolone resistance protein
MADRRLGSPGPPTTSTVDPASFDPDDLSGRRFEAVLFTDVDLADVTVRKASFDGCTFRDIRFNASTHVDAAFTNCTFVMCNFFDARMRDAKLVGSRFDGCAYDLLEVDGGDWSLVGMPGADLRRASFRGVRLREVDLGGAQLDGAALRDCDLSGAWLHGASFRGADLRGSDLSSLDPRQCEIQDALIDVDQAMVIAATLGLRFA